MVLTQGRMIEQLRDEMKDISAKLDVGLSQYWAHVECGDCL